MFFVGRIEGLSEDTFWIRVMRIEMILFKAKHWMARMALTDC